MHAIQLPRHTAASLRPVYYGWSNAGVSRGYATESKPYDVVVIGGGPGGYVAGQFLSHNLSKSSSIAAPGFCQLFEVDSSWA